MPARFETHVSGTRAPADLRVAPGAPGMEPRWTSSAKTGVGTALDARSRVWFTLSHGVLNEIYYPRVDQATTRDFGLLVSGPGGYFAEEKRDAESRTELLAPGVPAYRLVNTARDGRWRVTKTVVTHPEHDALVQHVRFESLDGTPLGDGDVDGWRVFALLAPHLGNQGAHNGAWVGDYKGVGALFAQRGNIALALACSAGWADATAGYVGVSDGWQDVRAHGRLTTGATLAPDGNVALCGEVRLAAGHAEGASAGFVLALGFGQNAAEAGQRARLALQESFDAIRDRYVRGWEAFLGRGTMTAAPEGAAADLVRLSTAVLRTHEDRRAPGGMIASLSIPWGQAKGDHDLGGYHLIWPRDLVECAGGLLAAGHFGSARRTLRFLMATQEADGRWPQNMWLDGTPYWEGVQMDETAFPILLADLALRTGALADAPGVDPWPMARRAAGFLLRNGPVTQQDRWEEDAGYSPFTLAVEIAALLAAADLAERAGDGVAAEFLRDAADVWNAGVERWTYVTDTDLARQAGVAGYYARIAPPDVAEAYAPAGGWVPIKNRVDPDFRDRYDHVVSPDALALVRFGLRAPNDPRILDTLRVVDATLKTGTPTGPVWHRYTDDGYGEHADGAPFDGSGIGRGWPLFAGERGHWALACNDAAEARRMLDVMAAQAGEGGLIPEQVWDAPDIPERDLYCGRPSGSAMPLAWAHAEYLKLARSLADGRIFDLPPQAAARYAAAPNGTPPAPRVALWAPHQKVRGMATGQTLRVLTPEAATVHWSADGWATTHDTPAERPGSLRVYAADLDTAALPAGAEVRFTIRWADARGWAGEDWTVAVGAAR